MALINFSNTNVKFTLVLLFSFFLTACGGGSSSDTVEPSTENVEAQTPVENSTPAPVTVAAVQITNQPQGVTVTEGGNATFAVSAVGGGTLSFQWRRAAQNIQGATTNTLSLSNVTSADAALYDVVVSNSAGSVASLSALLTVNAQAAPSVAPVVIVTQPQSLTIDENASATFSVAVTGGGSISYQWLKNGEMISGETSSILTLSSATSADAGNYSVVVTNSVGAEISNSAALQVNAVQVLSSIELTWDIPQEREDGSELTLGEINGYVIAYGTSENDLSNELVVEGASVTSAVLENLNSGTYYFSIATVDSDGVQGAYSGVINQAI